MTQPTYVVIGNPIAHSKSPQIHALFAAQFAGKPEVEGFLYDRMLAPLDGFVTTVHAFAAAGGRGANVTVPFKELAFHMVHRPSQRASVAGAVNTLTFNSADKTWSGDNTDGAGLVADILRHTDIRDKRVLLLGAGGAARGVIHPLLEQKLKYFVIANRNQSKAAAIFNKAEVIFNEAEAIFEEINSKIPSGYVTPTGKDAFFRDYFPLGFVHNSFFGIPTQACAFDDEFEGYVEKGLKFDIVINATSASLAGERLPIPNGVFAPNALAYDMMYGKDETPFLAQAREAGVELRVDGLGMLVGQAAEAFALWTRSELNPEGLRPDVEPVLQWMREQL